MSRTELRALSAELARFETEVHQLALAMVRAILHEELQRKRVASRPRVKRGRRAPKDRRAVAAKPDGATPIRTPKTWTRESIVAELATWMGGGTAIDATFVSRHGPPGLVAAARRIFGRFEAALNVAALHRSKLNPEGATTRRAA
jgi:hypothetical protein